MELLTKLQEDMKAALKGGQKERLQVIRMMLSDVKNIDLMPNKPTEQQAVEAYAKKLRKSMEEYEKINRKEEADKLKWELGVVEEYLPKKADAGDTEKLVADFLAKNSFTEKEVGKAMGLFMKENAGKVDAGAANAAMRKALAGK
jgi:uncharacterized protein YqeY